MVNLISSLSNFLTFFAPYVISWRLYIPTILSSLTLPMNPAFLPFFPFPFLSRCLSSGNGIIGITFFLDVSVLRVKVIWGIILGCICVTSCESFKPVIAFALTLLLTLGVCLIVGSCFNLGSSTVSILPWIPIFIPSPVSNLPPIFVSSLSLILSIGGTSVTSFIVSTTALPTTALLYGDFISEPYFLFGVDFKSSSCKGFPIGVFDWVSLTTCFVVEPLLPKLVISSFGLGLEYLTGGLPVIVSIPLTTPVAPYGSICLNFPNGDIFKVGSKSFTLVISLVVWYTCVSSIFWPVAILLKTLSPTCFPLPLFKASSGVNVVLFPIGTIFPDSIASWIISLFFVVLTNIPVTFFLSAYGILSNLLFGIPSFGISSPFTFGIPSFGTNSV